MAHQVMIFKILWHAEPNEARFENLQEQVTVVEGEVRTKLLGVNFLQSNEFLCQNGPNKANNYEISINVAVTLAMAFFLGVFDT